MKTFRAKTLTELHDDIAQDLVWAERDDLDMVTSVDVQLHNIAAEAESMTWHFDLKDAWLSSQRWSMMVRQYLDPVEVQTWRSKIYNNMGLDGRGIAMMRTKTVAARGGKAVGNQQTRRWGSCMLAVSFKARPQPQITLYSRTSYIGYLSGLDLSVAWVLARYLARDLGCKVEDFKFLWYNEAVQFHGFKSLAYLLHHPTEADLYRGMLIDADEPENDLSPALMLCRKWLQRTLKEDYEKKTYGDTVYNTYRRIRRRFHTEVLGYEHAKQFEGYYLSKRANKKEEKFGKFMAAYKPLPSITVDDLDLKSIALPYESIGKR